MLSTRVVSCIPFDIKYKNILFELNISRNTLQIAGLLFYSSQSEMQGRLRIVFHESAMLNPGSPL